MSSEDEAVVENENAPRCVGDWLHDLMFCGCMAIWLYIIRPG